MSQWPSAKAKQVLAALLKLGWETKRQTGSHRTLVREGWNDFVFAFHDGEEIGPRMLARIAKHTGLRRHYVATAHDPARPSRDNLTLSDNKGPESWRNRM
jgi:predicted RNA binding protein YcfA (HicA-like mRNA interferase family)